MRTLTIAALTTLHADRSAHGPGRAPSIAECLDAARAGRLYDVDTQSAGYDGLSIGDDADDVIAEWAEACGVESPRGWTAERVGLAEGPETRTITVDQFVRVERCDERCDENSDGDVIDDLICTGGDLAHEPRVALHNDPSRPTCVHEMTAEEVALCHRNIDLMDDDIRNALDGAGDDDREWLALYAARHEAVHGAPWCLP